MILCRADPLDTEKLCLEILIEVVKMTRSSAKIGLVLLLSTAGWGQASESKPAFDIADVHVSPRSDWVKTPAKAMQGGFLNAGRYELRRATMLDLIRTAYSVDADKVYGGPSWLDYDRFEVVAKAPAGTRPQTLRLMLQSVLEDRFKLAVKMDTKPVPAYVLSAAKGKPKLKPAEGSGSSGCQNLAPTIKEVPYGNIQCRNVTMEAFAAALRRLSPAYFGNLPVVDSTGLDGAWDIDLQYPMRAISVSSGQLVQPGGSIFDAIEKQLGLTVEQGKVPQPVLVVESVNEQPSPNPPGVAASFPPLPPPEFEVASLRPCDGTGPSLAPRFESGGRVTAHCMPLMTLISQAWGLAPFQELVGAPKWLTGPDAPSLSINAKAPEGAFMDAQGAQDRDALNAMMRALLVDRFQMKIHYEDRPVDAYTLVAVKPKLAKADPSNRTGCARQNTPGNPALGLVCKNMTMAQFSEQLQGYEPTIFYPVVDGSGLEGAWDFTLSFDPSLNPQMQAALAQIRARAGGAPAAAPAEASEPSGRVSFIEAIEKQLGLKLETRKRPEPVLVLDHIEEKPTDN